MFFKALYTKCWIKVYTPSVDGKLKSFSDVFQKTLKSFLDVPIKQQRQQQQQQQQKHMKKLLKWLKIIIEQLVIYWTLNIFQIIKN